MVSNSLGFYLLRIKWLGINIRKSNIIKHLIARPLVLGHRTRCSWGRPVAWQLLSSRIRPEMEGEHPEESLFGSVKTTSFRLGACTILSMCTCIQLFFPAILGILRITSRSTACCHRLDQGHTRCYRLCHRRCWRYGSHGWRSFCSCRISTQRFWGECQDLSQWSWSLAHLTSTLCSFVSRGL